VILTAGYKSIVLNVFFLFYQYGVVKLSRSLKKTNPRLFRFIEYWRLARNIKSRLPEERKNILIECGVLDVDRIEKALAK
jgi:hypothetical protein